LIPFFTLPWWGLNWGAHFPSNYSRLTLSAVLGAATLVLFTATLGRFTHDVPLAFWMSAGVSGILSLLAFWRLPKSELGTWQIRFNYLGLVTLILSALLSITVATIAIRFSFHDQIPVQAHAPLIESLLRGNLPPSLMTFPDIPLKYHYGADLFGAIMSYITGLPAYRAIDITQIFGWIAAMASLFLFCREMNLGRAYSLAALFWVLLASGWPYLLKPWLASPEELGKLNFDWPVSYILFFRHLNPGTVNNFFMTPYSLGFCLFFSYLTLFSRSLKQKSVVLVLFLALLLGALALIQVTFFATLLAASLVVLGAEALLKRRSWRDFLMPAAILILLSLLFGKITGGFFVRSEAYSHGLLNFNWPPGYLKNSLFGIGHPPLTWREGLLWYLCTLGSLVPLSLPFIFLALVSLKKNFNPMLLFLLFYALECFLMTQFFSYKLSWDIIKWFTGFHMSMILLIILLWSQFSSKKIFLSLLLGLCLLLDITPSLRFLSSLAYLNAEQVHPINKGWWRAIISAPGDDLAPILQALRASPWNEMILTTQDLGAVFGRYSGQASAVPDRNTEMFGVRPEILLARSQLNLALQKSFDLQTMRSSPIRWIIYSCGDFEKIFSEESKIALQSGVASGELKDLSFVLQRRCWKVFHLLSKPSLP